MVAIETYLDRVMAYANRRGAEAAAIRDEMRDHLLEKIEHICHRGVPLDEAAFTAIRENGRPMVVGYSLRPIFPLIDVRLRGTARGVVAIGPRAVGVFAFGGVAVGVFAVGALSLGVVSIGAVVAALIFAWGGVAVAPLGLASGAVAVGLVAVGVFSVGVIAGGLWSLGLWAGGTHALSLYPYETVHESLRWIGPWVPGMEKQGWLFIGVMAVVLPALVLGQRAMIKEQKRLEEIDPELRGEDSGQGSGDRGQKGQS